MPRSDIIDLTGRQIGEWTVLEYAGRYKTSVFWKCQCSCGVIKNINGQYLRKTKVNSRCAKCALNHPIPGEKIGYLTHIKDGVYQCICGKKKKLQRSVADKMRNCGCMKNKYISWTKKPRPNIQPLTTTDTRSKILNMWLLGYTGGEIGRRIGLSRQRVAVLIAEKLEELGM